MSNIAILLPGYGVIAKEGLADEAITPGALLERTATGFANHGTAAGNAAASFADINPEIGRGLDTDYADGDQIRVAFCAPGVEVNALVAAGADAITAGDYLESAGDGTLRLVATDTDTPQGLREGIVARALEAVDNSGGGSAVRIKVEVV